MNVPCCLCSRPLVRCKRRLWERLLGARSAWRCPKCGGRHRGWPWRPVTEEEPFYGRHRELVRIRRATPAERGERLMMALMLACVSLFALALGLAFGLGR